MGLFEIHCHTSEVSACGWVDAANVVRIHKDAGFEGICITDHYHEQYFKSRQDMKDCFVVDDYLSGYRKALKEGKRLGLKVFLGMEIKFPESLNDYLVYGLTEEMIYDNPYMFMMGLEDFSSMARRQGLLLIQAHPFRDNMVRVNPVFIDGVETVNGNLRIDSRNNLSNKYAIENNLIKMGGSDFHRECDINLAAMEFLVDINSNDDLVKAISNGEYTIIQNPISAKRDRFDSDSREEGQV